MSYNTKNIEEKWRKFWRNTQIYKTSQPNDSAKKFYVLGAWAYPSGDAHMGHVRNYTITDVIARYRRLLGYNVLHPVGWDAFGLPTENAALKKNSDPFSWNKISTENMKEQFSLMGYSYDWGNCIDTSHTEYYKWAQWLLIKFWEAGLLYKANKSVNWCTSCNTVLANEQVKDNLCERCGSTVIRKDLEQWFLRTTQYADRLIEDMKLLNEWPEYVLKMQENWIRNKDGTTRLEDWCISRQRYWGAPIPFVICKDCGVQPVALDSLPVVLPKGIDFTPGWPPPLARANDFMHTECPKCHKEAERSPEVMDTFVFSSWYFLRFTDPRNSTEIFSKTSESYWMPVDFYVSGIELANNHLIYARFFHKALYDMGLVSEPEPFKRFFAQGMILLNSEKMSKSKGNVVSPIEIINRYGADTLRTFILFMGPPDSDVEWNNEGIRGSSRFLQRSHGLVYGYIEKYNHDWRNAISKDEPGQSDNIMRMKTHALISKSVDILENTMSLNVLIALMMEFSKELDDYLNSNHKVSVASEAIETYVVILSLFAPYLGEELWQLLGFSDSVTKAKWPTYSKDLVVSESISIVVQINGKKKRLITISPEEAKDESMVTKLARELLVKPINERRVIYVPSKIINFVI